MNIDLFKRLEQTLENSKNTTRTGSEVDYQNLTMFIQEISFLF